MPQKVFERLLYGMAKSARHGARFCLREFLSKRNIPSVLMSQFERNKQLERNLEVEEVNFVYRFITGVISPVENLLCASDRC
jgi:S-adenosylmethionine-diacylglycerol 3-amino-3-carboxypropyl transferase